MEKEVFNMFYMEGETKVLFINSKLTVKLSEENKDMLKTKMGKNSENVEIKSLQQ